MEEIYFLLKIVLVIHHDEPAWFSSGNFKWKIILYFHFSLSCSCCWSFTHINNSLKYLKAFHITPKFFWKFSKTLPLLHVHVPSICSVLKWNEQKKFAIVCIIKLQSGLSLFSIKVSIPFNSSLSSCGYTQWEIATTLLEFCAELSIIQWVLCVSLLRKFIIK